MKSFNPFSFTPIPVTIIVTIVYFSITVPLIVKHEVVPRAPKPGNVPHGLNISEAWLDLEELTNGYHPYNSHRNDEVRNWLLKRVQDILDSNGVDWTTEISGPPELLESDEYRNFRQGPQTSNIPDVIVFNDLLSNLSSSAVGSLQTTGSGRNPGQSVYFEGTNIMVYIRGTEDDEEEWWKSGATRKRAQTHGKGGVLVNAHYDSVSTGYGATDTGIGVVSILQIIRYFSTPGNRPKKGVVALFNNGEESFLNGARAYARHPISEFTHTFLNLEGTGAGGRATLFRTTDAQVTKPYAQSSNPFGTVISGDAFKTGAIRSQTDYVIFEGILGLRGLDIAFWHPRQQYHTDQDDARHTNVNSLWHMLSGAVTTVKGLASDTSSFVGERGDGAKDKVRNGKGDSGVWFDLFGKGFALFSLRALFAWSLVLLIVGPLSLFAIIYGLIRKDKFYFFSNKVPSAENEDETPVSLKGWRGFFRFPLSFIVASGLVIGSAYLLTKINPLIIHSSQYSVWVQTLSLWFVVFWFLSATGNAIRPSALHRGYSILWLFFISWALLVAATVYEDRFGIAGVYFIVFYQAATFFAALISLLELFALPSKSEFLGYAKADQGDDAGLDIEPEFQPAILQQSEEGEAGDEEPTENTPLIRSDDHSPLQSTTFAPRDSRSFRNSVQIEDDEFDSKHPVYGREQKWSGHLPSWTWILQFLLLAPFNLILIGQIGLLLSFAVSQTGQDGSSTLVPYLIVSIFSIFFLLPVSPFTHRLTPHIPAFVALVFVGTLIYNLTAFPFSANNRYKTYFQQSVDLETGENQVSIVGVEQYVRSVIANLPSAAGQEIECRQRADSWRGLKFCSWTGIPPQVIPNAIDSGVPPELSYSDWLDYNVTRTPGRNAARFVVQGRNTRACVLRFDRPISDFTVVGSVRDDRFEAVPEGGSSQIKLWHRNWDEPWTVDVEWPVSDGKQPGDEGMEGQVVGLWSDNNTPGLIPALDEIRRYMPPWAAVSKMSDGLVEGVKKFIV